MSKTKPRQAPPVREARFETVTNDVRALDTVENWLALGCEFVFAQQGQALFRLGVPCRRKMTRPPETRQVFVDAEVSEAVWVSPLVDRATDDEAESTHTEEREVVPAEYSYEAPRPLIGLYPSEAQWAYRTFKAAEFDAMYRLRDGSDWRDYVQELQAGMAKR